MNGWLDIGWPLAALACLGIGIFCGWHWGRDHAADAETEARFAAVPPPGRHRQAAPRVLPAAPKAVSRSTAELFAALEAEMTPATAPMRRPWVLHADEVPVMAPARQARLGQLVAPAREHRPGSTTDFIALMQRETDQYIEQIGAGQ